MREFKLLQIDGKPALFDGYHTVDVDSDGDICVEHDDEWDGITRVYIPPANLAEFLRAAGWSVELPK